MSERSKQFLKNYVCNCPKQCNQKIEEQIRETLFKRFWDLASYDTQTGFIASTVKQMPVKRKRSKNGPGKTYSRTYLLGNVEVCRNMYIKTYQVSTKRVNSALTKLRDGRLKDERGKEGGKKKISEETIQIIIKHIKKFPTYVSHYAREQTGAKFLPFDLTELKMYELYTEEGNPKVSFSFFKAIFYKHFNLRRKPPIKDTCNKCDLLSAQVKNIIDENVKLDVQSAHKQHLADANFARNELQKDMKEASTSPFLETVMIWKRF